MTNTIIPCLWFDHNAEEAANFYAATFPDSEVKAILRSPGDFPSGKKGDVLTVEFTVLGSPFLGLNGGPNFTFSEAISFQVLTGGPGRDRPLLECDCLQRRQRKPVRLVQGQVRSVVADHAETPDRVVP